MAKKSKKSKKNKQRSKQRSSIKANPSEIAEGELSNSVSDSKLIDAETIRQLIAQGKAKRALDVAKQFHKLESSSESESLLIEAYHLRMQTMIEKGLIVEARALMEMVQDKYSVPKAQFEQIEFSLAAQEGKVEDILYELINPDLPVDRKSVIETFIKREIFDLSVIAECEAVPNSHPLRIGAAAILEAFTAVTSRSVNDEEITLAEVSRRSPLFSWKMLVRAIAGFYRGDDELCEKYLKSIDPHSVPGRLAEPLRSMMKGENKFQDIPQVSFLIEEISDNSAKLKHSLKELDEFHHQNDIRNFRRNIKTALKLCKITKPRLAVKLKQHIFVKCILLDISPDTVFNIFGSLPKRDAYSCRLFARAEEIQHRPLSACKFWENFRIQAVKEKWFEDQSPESAVVFTHMAELLENLPEDYLDEEREEFIDDLSDFDDFIDENKYFYLFPEKLYQRACEIDPCPEYFDRWVNLVKNKDKHQKEINKIALSWHQAFPKDSKPLILLMDLAENRNAFQKAMNYLEMAESIDSLNPNVRNAYLRLHISIAKRHLKQEKFHLIQEDFKNLAALQELQTGDRPAFLTALKWILAKLKGETDNASKLFKETASLLDSEISASLIIRETLDDYRISSIKPPQLPVKLTKAITEELLEAVLRAHSVGKDFGILVNIPKKWESALIKSVENNGKALNFPQILKLGEAALESDLNKLAFAVSGAGLKQYREHTAEFLFCRAQSFDYYSENRREECILAVITLARQQRNLELLDKAVELWRDFRVFSVFDYVFGKGTSESETEMDDLKLREVIERERKAVKYPAADSYRRRAKIPYEMFKDDCDCPNCRRRRGETEYEKTEKREKTKRRKKDNSQQTFLDFLGDEVDDFPPDW